MFSLPLIKINVDMGMLLQTSNCQCGLYTDPSVGSQCKTTSVLKKCPRWSHGQGVVCMKGVWLDLQPPASAPYAYPSMAHAGFASLHLLLYPWL